MKTQIYNIKAEKVGEATLPKDIFEIKVSAGFNKRNAAIAQKIPTGILIKKIQCQDKLSLIEPPKIGPRIGPTTVVMAHMPIA